MISEAAILDAIREALGPEPEPEDALTLRELCQLGALGQGEFAKRPIREILRTLIQNETVECVKVRRMGIDGRNSLVPAYRIKG